MCCYHSGLKQVEWEVNEKKKKTLQGASDGRCQIVFVLKCCMSRGRSLSGNAGLGAQMDQNVVIFFIDEKPSLGSG